MSGGNGERDALDLLIDWVIGRLVAGLDDLDDLDGGDAEPDQPEPLVSRQALVAAPTVA